MEKKIIQDFIVDTANHLLDADINQDKCSLAMFSPSVNITPWGIIHIIDEANKKYNFYFDATDIVTNSNITINDLVESIYRQLLAI